MDDDQPVQAGQVALHLDCGLGEGLLRQGADGLPVIVADLEEDDPLRSEVSRGLAQELLDEAQAFGAAVEGEAWLVAADLGGKRFPVVRSAVGQVGGDEVDRLSKRGEEVALQEADAGGEAEALGVAAGEVEGSGGTVGGDDLGVREGGSQGESDGAAAGADVDDGDGRILGPAVDDGQGLLDEELGLGSGDRGDGRDLKLKSVELLAADDVGGGLTLEAAVEQSAVGGIGVGRELVGQSLVELGAVEAEDVAEEDLRLEGRFVDARLCEAGGGLAKGLAQGQARVSRRRWAWSWVERASRISSISPSRMAGRLWKFVRTRWSVTRSWGKL